MKALVCGGREINDKIFVFNTLDKLDEEHHFTYIITGGANGADFLAHQWASVRRKDAHIFLPSWEKHGRAAGMIRNQEMLKYGQPDIVIAFPGGKGTEHMKKIARKAEIPVIEVEYNKSLIEEISDKRDKALRRLADK